MKSYLSNRLPESPTPPEQLHRMAAAAFHKEDIVVIPLSKVTNDFDRQHIINVGEKLYGKRREKCDR